MTTSITPIEPKPVHPAREFLERARLAKQSIERSGVDDRSLMNFTLNLYAAVEAVVEAVEAQESAPCTSVDQVPGVMRRGPGRPREAAGAGV